MCPKSDVGLFYTREGIFRNCLDIDKNLQKLEQIMVECSGEYRIECDKCPVSHACHKWWSGVSQRYAIRHLRDEELSQLEAKFRGIQQQKIMQPSLI